MAKNRKHYRKVPIEPWSKTIAQLCFKDLLEVLNILVGWQSMKCQHEHEKLEGACAHRLRRAQIESIRQYALTVGTLPPTFISKNCALASSNKPAVQYTANRAS